MSPLPEPTSGLPIPRSCSTAKPQAKRPADGPERLLRRNADEAPPRRPVVPSRGIPGRTAEIRTGRVRSGPPDQDPRVRIRGYRFARGFKSGPSISDPAGGIRSELSESQERWIQIRRSPCARTPSRDGSNLSRQIMIQRSRLKRIASASLFAKEPSGFYGINPQSICSSKVITEKPCFIRSGP
jgi:hypothetical protein